MNTTNALSRVLDRDEFLTPFDRLFDDFFTTRFPQLSTEFGEHFFEKGSYPKVNVVELDNSVEIVAEIPGLKKEDVRVEIVGDSLVIAGSAAKQNEVKGTYIRRELKRSAFKRSFILGDTLNKETIDAKFEDGILKVTVQKITPTKTAVKKIEIK